MNSKFKTYCLILSIGLLLGAFGVIYCTSQDASNDAYCLECHGGDFDNTKKYIHPLIEEGKCRDCHNDYDESIHVEDTKPEIETCIECHPEEELGRSHPVGDGVIDPNTNDTMTCVSTCHDLHGSDNKYYLPYKNNMVLCLSCHKEF